MAAKTKLFKGLLTSVFLASLMTSITIESNNAFATAVPNETILSSIGGSPSKLSDTAADQRWVAVRADGTFIPLNFIDPPSNNEAVLMDQYDIAWFDVSDRILAGINVNAGAAPPVPSLPINIIENVTIGSIINTLGIQTVDFDISCYKNLILAML
ncbi:MAG: hypothetical protein RCG15_00225 [Candidatus Rickettsia vulgarisii]